MSQAIFDPAAAAAPPRPEIHREPRPASEFGLVERRLSVWELSLIHI